MVDETGTIDTLPDHSLSNAGHGGGHAVAEMQTAFYVGNRALPAGGATMNRCDHQTTRGTRCRREGRYYVRHADGQEYRSCASHLAEFVPHKKAKGRPVQPDEEMQPETA